MKYNENYLNKIIENRIIFLNGEINNQSANEVIMQLLYLDSINNNDIKLYINSNGGDVVQGLAIIDCINTIKSNVKTVCVGACYSMAAIILMCGTKGKRMMLPNSEIMIHEVSGTLAGKFNDISLSKERMNEKNNKIISLIVEKTKLKKNEVIKMLKTDTFLNSNKSLLYGFIDNVIC